jgi:glycine oxidase
LELHDRIVVLGGGIIGLSLARTLARDGHRVTVVDPDAPGSHASARAGGILVRRAVRHSLERGKMFYTRSIDRWPSWIRELESESGCAIPLWEGGDYCLFAHAGRARRFAANLERESDGADWQELDHLPPELQGAVSEGFRLFHFPQEMCLDPRLALVALEGACRKRGVDLGFGWQGLRVERDGRGWRIRGQEREIQATLLVVAAGPWSASILERLGWTARTAAVRGQIALVPALYPGLAMVHLEDTCYAVPRFGQTLIGATSEVGQWEESATPEGMAALQRRMLKVFPRLDLSMATQVWAGIRPRTLDRVPHLGWLEEGRLLVASGHYRSGISMAPLTGEVVADLVAGRAADGAACDLDAAREGAGYQPGA